MMKPTWSRSARRLVARGLAAAFALVAAAAVHASDAPPSISTQPSNQTVPVGAPVVFFVGATGTPAPTYQWRKNGRPMEGATAAVLTIAGARITDTADYSVVVSNSAGKVTSSAATLALRPFTSGTSVAPTSTGAAVYAFSTLAGQASIGSADGTGSAARFNSPAGCAVDASGNIYIADQNNATIRKVTPAGVVTTFAGLAGVTGSADGTGSAARFGFPIGLTFDPSGNLTVLDAGYGSIRKITPAGVTSTFVTSSNLYSTYAVAADPNGNLYLTDRSFHVVWKITAGGTLSVFAGQLGASGSADGTGNAARFLYPFGITCDATGANIYVADSGNMTVRKITSAGVVTTLAGSAGQFGSADGTGSAARFSDPIGIGVDSTGSLYVTDSGGNDTIRKISPAGVVTTIAGSLGFPGANDGTGSAAQFTYPFGVAGDKTSTAVYVTDLQNNNLRKVTAAGVVTTMAGDAGYGSADGTGAAARFQRPNGVAVAPGGGIYVSDTANHTIRKITSAGVVTTFAGQAGSWGEADGTGSNARFTWPLGLDTDASGNVYVADSSTQTIRKITPTGVVTTIAGSPWLNGYVDGTGSAARFANPLAVAVDGSGNVFVADSYNCAVRKITAAGVVTTFAGGTFGANDGTGTSAQFYYPNSIGIDSGGNLYVGDAGAVRKITASAVVTTLAGVVGASGTQDGQGSAARFYTVNGVVADTAGYVYVSDNNCIRRISPAGLVTTIAGNRYGGVAATDGAASARFNRPSQLAMDSAGRLYVADENNHIIRIAVAATAPTFTAQPTNVSTPAGATVTFSATATGAPAPSLQWMRKPSGGSIGNVTDSGPYGGARTTTVTVTGVTMAMNGDQFQLYAYNDVGLAVSSFATLTVTNAPYITSAMAATFGIGVANTFTVTSTGTPAPTFSVAGGTLPSWANLNAATGVISGTPPDATGAPFTLTLQATNGVGSPATQVFTLSVAAAAAPAFSQQPQNVATPAITGNATFTADATGLPVPTFQWQRQPAGTTGFSDLANSGTYSGVTTKTLGVAAPAASTHGDQFRCVATNSVGATASSAATLTVLVAPVISSANSTTFEAGIANTFTVAATGTPTPTFSVSAGVLPAWASLNATSGVISGTPPSGTSGSYPFTLQVNNGYQSATQNFTLTVINGPIITAQPASVATTVGAPASLNVTATGSGSLTYQWRRFGVALAGATSSSYALGSASQADTDIYDVAVTDSIGTTISAPARIGVAPLLYPTNVELDPAFDLGIEASSASVTVVAPHTGGAILVGGNFVRANGKRAQRIARYLANGSIDSTFSTEAAGISGVSAIVTQPDGKILIGGDFYFINGVARRGIARLNPDGTLDGAFNPIVNSSVSLIVLQPDGTMFISGGFSSVNGTARSFLARLNADGTLDSSFVPPAMDSAPLKALVVQADGKIVIAGFFSTVSGVSRGRIARLFSDGTLDTSFAGGTGFASTVNAIVTDSSGDLVVAGAFSTYNGATVGRLVKLSRSDGTLLSSYGGGFDLTVTALALQSDGKLVCGGSFTTFNGTAASRVARLGAGGALDSSFTPPALAGTVNTLYWQPADGSVVCGGSTTFTVAGAPTPLARLTASGAQDTTLTAAMRSPGSVYKLEPLANGKFLIAGVFTHIANTAVSNNIARLNANFTPDPTFNAGGSGAGSTVSSVVRFPDGKLAISGSFTSYNGNSVGRVARLNADGSFDATFNSGGSGASSTADLLVLYPGGKLVLGGQFSTFNGTPTPSGLVRLNTDGSLDSSFNAGPNALSLTSSNALAAQADGKVYVGGNFTTINSVAQNRIARLNADGSVDSTFNVGTGFDGTVTWVLLEPDGRMIVAGFFANYRGTSVTGSMVRLLSTGDVAGGFTSSAATLFSGLRQEDGKLLLYQSTLPKRLLASGATDASFNVYSAGSSSSGRFSAMRILDDGRVLMGNSTMLVANLERDGLMLLKPIAAPAITTQPVSQAVYSGANVTLSVVATGSAFNTYQWSKNGVPIGGATNSTLAFNSISPFDGGSFTVTITNALGTVTSNGASLTVTPSSIAPIPGPFVGVGGTARMTAVVSAAPPLAYQWSKNGTPITSGTDAALLLSPVAAGDAGVYEVTVSTGNAPLTSNPVILTVLPNPLAYSSRQVVSGSGLTGYFAIEGSQPKRVLLRAIGPTLATLGVSGALADPRIALLRADGVGLFANDNWGTLTGTNLPAIFTQLGAFSLPAGSLDAVIYATLAPGSYSVRITGADTNPGVALLELFDADTNPASRINYVAVRGGVDATSGSMVGGLTMTNSANKRMLVRAVGSNLIGVGAHPDPQLRVLDGSFVFAQNDNWGGASALTAAAAQAGAFALPPASTDAAVLVDTRVGTGAYTMAMPANGSSGEVLLEFYDLAGTANSILAPLIVVPPASQSAAVGDSVTLRSVAVGSGTLAYQWRKNATAIANATTATLTIASAQTTDSGVYDVTVTSARGTARSEPVTVLIGISGVHTMNGLGYLPGGTVTITNTFGYTGAADVLGWETTLPSGWTYVSDGGNAGDVKPAAGASGTLAWAWTTAPRAPVTFTYTVRAPADVAGPQAFTAEAMVRSAGVSTRTTVSPATLNVTPVPTHSADTDLDFRISLVELTRVIELFNTRNGSTRTGAYRVDVTGEDGFAPDPTRASGTSATLTRYHSADTRSSAAGSPPDGRLDLFELTRVIELYNYRSGTTRTGQYHVQSGTEDGFAPGP